MTSAKDPMNSLGGVCKSVIFVHFVSFFFSSTKFTMEDGVEAHFYHVRKQKNNALASHNYWIKIQN